MFLLLLGYQYGWCLAVEPQKLEFGRLADV